MNVYVNRTQLIEKSNDIGVLKNELDNIMNQIEELVLSVNGPWQGEAERAFSEKILFVKKQFSGISAFFDDYSELLKTFTYGYDQQENDLVSKINLA